ncbi:MAG: hypothetical protein ABI765_15535 [Gemmatimonadota bacterium]
MDFSRLLPASPSLAGIVRLGLDPRAPAPDLAALGRGAAGWAESGDTITVSPAFLDLVTDIVSADSEQRSDLRDRHDRVPPQANALVRAGGERGLVLQSIAGRLREAVVRLADGKPVRLLAPWPADHRWAVGLSHDLDVVALWPLFTGLRLAELMRHGALAQAGRTLVAGLGAAFSDPVSGAVAGLLGQEFAAQVRSTWFVLCGTPTLSTFRDGDLTYSPESARARAIFERLAAAGHEIGLHGSFETSRRPAAFSEQRARLARLTGSSASGVRQHFVRLRPGTTHVSMAEAGFQYDASMGFSDRNGFRLGVADVVPGWSAERQAVAGPDLLPFAWMDRALSKYRGVEDPAVWVADGLELADHARAVEGLWAGIWHPNLVPALGYPGAPEANAELMKQLRRTNPWVATHRDLVTWRRARRSAMAMAIDAEGRVSAESRGPVVAPLGLESPLAEPREPVLARA